MMQRHRAVLGWGLMLGVALAAQASKPSSYAAEPISGTQSESSEFDSDRAEAPSPWLLLPKQPEERRVQAFGRLASEPDARDLAPLVDLLAFANTRDEWFRVLDGIQAILDHEQLYEELSLPGMRSVDRPWRNLTLQMAADRDLPTWPDYSAWKGHLLAQVVDPQFTQFLYLDVPSRIRMDEVVWGGVPVDGIPALVNPNTLSVEQADFLDEDELIFGVSLNGEHRAYPLRILDWHEMANDVVGGVSIALAYCTLCGAAVLYDTQLDEQLELGEAGVDTNDRRLEFGSSGLLMRSNKLMYDRQTNSLWNQFTGRPVVGPLVATDAELRPLPVLSTSWGEWKRRHPETSVVSPSTGHNRDYRPGAAYGEYFASGGTMFPAVGSEERTAKERVFVVRTAEASEAFRLSALREQPTVRKKVSDRSVLLVSSALQTPRALPAAWRATVSELFSKSGSSPSYMGELTKLSVVALLAKQPELAGALTTEDLLSASREVREFLLNVYLEGNEGLQGPGIAKEIRNQVASRALIGDVRAYDLSSLKEDRDRSFEVASKEEAELKAEKLQDSTGQVWLVTAEALVSGKRRLPRLPGHLAYRFALDTFPLK